MSCGWAGDYLDRAGHLQRSGALSVDRWIADHAVPAVYGKLAGEDDRSAIMSVVDDLHKVPALGRGQLEHREVVQNQQADLGVLAH